MQIENIVRSERENVRVFMMLNQTEDCPELMAMFGFIPVDFGVYKLKRKLENGEKTKEKISADAVEKYTSHPYVKRCNTDHFTLNKQFYDEASIFYSYPVDEILGIFEIDGSDFPISV